MIKIGIIIDKLHYKWKASELIKFLKKKITLSTYIEEEYLLNNEDSTFDEDLFFVKGKGDIILSLVKTIEKETSIPVINSYKGIWTAFNRFINCTILENAGIPVPRYTLNPDKILPEFKDYISKNMVDQKTYQFKPKIEKNKGHLQVNDQRALLEKEQFHYIFYQDFIKSKWEYKVYCIGQELYFFKQIPVLINPNKMESRKEIDKIPELEEMALKAVEVVDLKISSIDFLKSKDGQYYLTDINSTPNFNYIKKGPEIIGNYLINQAKQ
ncbi:MAG: RimK family alpha-L-glutamate ligase [Promethearchaeota archaeon]